MAPLDRTLPTRPDMDANATRAFLSLFSAALLLGACDHVSAPRTAEGSSAGQQLDRALERTQEKLAEATEKTKEQLAVAGKKTHDTLAGASDKVEREAAGGRTSDTAITASIKASLLKDPDLSAIKIDVDTRDGVVALNGVAPDEAARERAGRIAEATKGVREVHNHVTAKKG
jgi:osmotically-inducible protein OsmY